MWLSGLTPLITLEQLPQRTVRAVADISCFRIGWHALGVHRVPAILLDLARALKAASQADVLIVIGGASVFVESS